MINKKIGIAALLVIGIIVVAKLVLPAHLATPGIDFLAAVSGYSQPSHTEQATTITLQDFSVVTSDSVSNATPATWNPRLPKIVSDGQWMYTVYTRYPSNNDGSGRVAWFYKKRVTDTTWQYTGRQIDNPHQIPGLSFDADGRLHIVFDCLPNKECPFPGINYGNTEKFLDLIFYAKNVDGSIDFGDKYWNYNESNAFSSGYMGIGTDLVAKKTYVSLAEEGTFIQHIFDVGVSNPTYLTVPLNTASVYPLYPQLAFSTSGVGWYSLGELVKNYVSTAQYKDIVLYKFAGGKLEKKFSDSVTSPDGNTQWIFPSDLTFDSKGKAIFAYKKVEPATTTCTYIAFEGDDGLFGGPVSAGCLNGALQLQSDSKNNLYMLIANNDTSLLLYKTSDKGVHWTQYTLVPQNIPQGTTGFQNPTIIKSWNSPLGFESDKIRGVVSGHKADATSSYTASFCIDLVDLNKSCSGIVPNISGVQFTNYATSTTAGSSLSVTWNVSNMTMYSKDWVAIVPSGKSWVSGNPWFYTDGLASGTKSLVVPDIPGVYDLAYYRNDGFVEVRRVSGVLVTPKLSTMNPPTPISAPASTITFPNMAQSGNSIPVSWNNLGTQQSGDWIGLHTKGGVWSQGLPWFYVTSSSGSKSMIAPAIAGIYEASYYDVNNSEKFKGASSVVVSNSSKSVDFSISRLENITAGSGQIGVMWSVTSGVELKADDWIAIVPVGGDWSNGLPWAYTNAVQKNIAMMSLPSVPGVYEVAYFRTGSGGKNPISRSSFSITVK